MFLEKLQDRIVNPKVAPVAEPGVRALGKKGEVTWDTFIEVTQGIVRDSLEGDACDVYAQKFGVPAGQWTDVQMGWLKKLQRNPILAVKYGQAMNAAVRPPG